MSELTKSAKGRKCTVRLPGTCNYNPETTVASHVPKGLRYGKGMGKKPSDLLIAYACSACHDVVDGRVKSNHESEFIELCWWRGHGETLVMLEKEGLITTGAWLGAGDVVYLTDRLESVVGLLNAGETHMAVAKLLADISALRAAA